MFTNKIAGRNIRAMADECCKKVEGCHLSRYDWRINLDSFDQAYSLLAVLSDANRYWQSMGKPSKAECAYKVMQYIFDLYTSNGMMIPKFPQFGKTYIDASMMTA